MKLKIIVVSVIGFLIYSCASRTVAPILVATEFKNEVVSNDLVEGKNLYENSCGQCHKLYSPKEYSSQEWQPILVRMQKKAHLNDTEMNSISSYINSLL